MMWYELIQCDKWLLRYAGLTLYNNNLFPNHVCGCLDTLECLLGYDMIEVVVIWHEIYTLIMIQLHNQICFLIMFLLKNDMIVIVAIWLESCITIVKINLLQSFLGKVLFYIKLMAYKIIFVIQEQKINQSIQFLIGVECCITKVFLCTEICSVHLPWKVRIQRYDVPHLSLFPPSPFYYSSKKTKQKTKGMTSSIYIHIYLRQNLRNSVLKWTWIWQNSVRFQHQTILPLFVGTYFFIFKQEEKINPVLRWNWMWHD